MIKKNATRSFQQINFTKPIYNTRLHNVHNDIILQKLFTICEHIIILYKYYGNLSMKNRGTIFSRQNIKHEINFPHVQVLCTLRFFFFYIVALCLILIHEKVHKYLEYNNLESTNLERKMINSTNLIFQIFISLKMWTTNLDRNNLDGTKLDRKNLNSININR